MTPVVITNENFDKEVMQSEKPVLIDFYADWCGPCKMLAPIVEKIAEEREDVKICKVNVDNERQLAANFDVMSIPTVVVVKSGKLYRKSVGLVPKQKLLEMLD
ncbi:MAG TPA: thioredoxin [Eubacteriales bacterium]|nr:thioredoxin [Eubacteriales bacterium]